MSTDSENTALFARVSACAFPHIPLCDGTQKKEIEHSLLVLHILNFRLMSNMYELTLILILVDFNACRTLRESEKMRIFLYLFCRAISRASLKAAHSAV